MLRTSPQVFLGIVIYIEAVCCVYFSSNITSCDLLCYCSALYFVATVIAEICILLGKTTEAEIRGMTLRQRPTRGSAKCTESEIMCVVSINRTGYLQLHVYLPVHQVCTE